MISSHCIVVVVVVAVEEVLVEEVDEIYVLKNDED